MIMGNKMIKLLSGIIIDEREMLSLAELCHCCGLQAEHIITMIEQGLVDPLESGIPISRWQFRADSVLRIQTAQRLQRDLQVNLEGAVLAVELLEEIKMLRQTVAYLKRD
jgi:chaperone modulatory protein CbpM